MSNRLMDYLLTVLVICAVTITALLVRQELRSPAEARPGLAIDNWEELVPGGRTLGPEQASVTIIAFSDFECRYCARFAEQVASLREMLGNQLRVVHRHFPLVGHRFARGAAIAAECAGDQDQFWEYHDAVFATQDSLGMIDWGDLAERAGVPDLERFNDCYISEEPSQRLTADRAVVDSLRITATPTFIINGKLYEGLLPDEELERNIIAILDD